MGHCGPTYSGIARISLKEFVQQDHYSLLFVGMQLVFLHTQGFPLCTQHFYILLQLHCQVALHPCLDLGGYSRMFDGGTKNLNRKMRLRAHHGAPSLFHIVKKCTLNQTLGFRAAFQKHLSLPSPLFESAYRGMAIWHSWHSFLL